MGPFKSSFQACGYLGFIVHVRCHSATRFRGTSRTPGSARIRSATSLWMAKLR